MATMQASSVVLSSMCCGRGRGRVNAIVNAPKIHFNPLALPKLPGRGLVEELEERSGGFQDSTMSRISSNTNSARRLFRENVGYDPEVAAKFYEVMEAVADRVEMHKNIGEQRNNWNSLLLTSINAMTLSAAIMTGMAAMVSASNGGTFLALKLSSAVLYASAAGMLAVMNKIQPSQLAEEQRNATRLFKQLHGELQTVVALGSPTISDVNAARERVLALDRAFPLPLLGKMIEKFPSAVEPAVWWPQQRRSKRSLRGKVNGNNNGWSGKLEEEMREIVEVLKKKDMDDYLKLGEKALKMNKMLAISGPLLTGLAAIGSAFVGTSHYGSWAVMLGVVCGSLASVVNTFEHGGQVGMVFEMYRSNAGFFKLMQETIESNVNEKDVDRRENGEVFQTKVALQLGRSLSELRHLAASSSISEEFASKLF